MDDDYQKDFKLLIEFSSAPNSNDRTMAIVWAAYAEKYLGELIKFKMPGLKSDLESKIFKPEGVLGPMGAKIDLGAALLVITKELAGELRLLASIRNHFAHNLAIQDIDHPEIAKQLNKFKTRPIPVGFDDKVQEAKVHAMYNNWTRRQKFEYIGLTLCSSLHSAMNAQFHAQLEHRSKD